MRNRSVEIIVGLFILGGIFALIVLALRVSGLNLSESNQSTYTVYAYFDNVDGLKKRARVSLAGVTIGKVTDIALNPDAFNAKVTMEISDQMNTLPADSTAIIYTAGLLGEKYIGFSIGGDTEVLANGSFVYDTQSTLVLEDLINKFVMNSDSSTKDMAKYLSEINDTLKQLTKEKSTQDNQ